MIVIDSSAVVELLLRTESGRRVAARVRQPGETLHAPHLLDVEVVNSLRKIVLRGGASEARTGEAIRSHLRAQVRRYSHTALLRRIWALRHNLSAYDAAYVALAEALDAPLITRDHRIADAPGHTARVEVF